MHSPLFWIAAGFLGNEIVDVILLIIIIRFFPHKIRTLQRLADALFIRFAHPKAFINARDVCGVYGVPEEEEEEEDGEEMCVHGISVDEPCEECEKELAEECDCPECMRIIIPEGTKVTFCDPKDSTYKPGITFKTTIKNGTLYYIVEYAVDGGDVGQVEVPAKEVWEEGKEPSI